MTRNCVELSGRLLIEDSLRHTPAGIAILGLILDHESAQLEAGHSRKVNVSVPCVAIGPVAERARHLGSGQGVKVKGFLAARKVNSRSVVLHITEIEIVEDC